MSTAQALQLTKEDARSRIEHEDTLINHRMSWLVGSQSFLFAAFVVLINNSKYYEPDAPAAYLDLAATLVYFIALVGLVISVCSFVGVMAAFFAIRRWKSCVPEQDRQGLTSDARIAHFGGMAAIVPAPVIASIWVLLLRQEWSALSRLTPVALATPLVIGSLVIGVWFFFNWRLIMFVARE